MAPRLIPASPVEHSAAARGFVVAASATAAFAVMVSAQDLPFPVAALAATVAGHRYSFVSRDRRTPLAEAVVALGLIGALGGFLADAAFGLFGGQLAQVHLALSVLAATSPVLRTRRNLYSSLWITLAILYLAAVYAWSYWFAALIACWALCLAGFWAATRLAALGDGGPRLPARPLAVAGGGVLAIAAAAFVLLPQPETRPLPEPVISLPRAAHLSGELEQPLLPLAGLPPSGTALDLRYRGRLGAGVVLTVRTPVPTYWRGQVFDRYRDGAWTANRHDFRTMPGSVGPGRIGPPQGPQRGTFAQVFHVVRSLPGPVVAADPVESLAYPAGELRRDHYGTWWAPGGLPAGTTYSAVSSLPDQTPASLERATGADAVDPEDLDVGRRSAGVAALARRVAGRHGGRYGVVAAVTAYLQTHYRYTLALERVPAGRDPVDWFLFDRRAGYCEQFATAETLMLRSLGIPARLATGYAPGEYSPVLRQAVVRERDAHAWVEVSFPGRGWVPFDPSPGYPGLAVAPLPTGWLAPDLARLLPRVSLSLAPTGLRAPAPPDLAAAGLAGLAAVAAAAVAAAGLARLRRRPTGELMGIYERVQRRLGRPRAPPETPREYREAVAAGDLRELLDDVTEAVERALYAGRPPTRARLDDLRRRLRRR